MIRKKSEWLIQQRWGLTVRVEGIRGVSQGRFGEVMSAGTLGRLPGRNDAASDLIAGENKSRAASEHAMPMCLAGRRRRPQVADEGPSGGMELGIRDRFGHA